MVNKTFNEHIFILLLVCGVSQIIANPCKNINVSLVKQKFKFISIPNLYRDDFVNVRVQSGNKYLLVNDSTCFKLTGYPKENEVRLIFEYIELKKELQKRDVGKLIEDIFSIYPACETIHVLNVTSKSKSFDFVVVAKTTIYSSEGAPNEHFIAGRFSVEKNGKLLDVDFLELFQGEYPEVINNEHNSMWLKLVKKKGFK